MSIQIVEVGPRDGLQNEKVKLPVDTRVEMVEKLIHAGLKRIEIGAFVSPKWVPQMADTSQLVRDVFGKDWAESGHYSVLVPNRHGMRDACQTQIQEVAVFGACSEGFSKKNINCTIGESFERFASIIETAKQKKLHVRGYLSTAFGCPYEGKVSPSKVVTLVENLFDLGVYEISIGDTIGVATPKQVRELIALLKPVVDIKKVAMHFHDTRGTALANVLASLDLGIEVFDASIGGLGGCPYAKGATGNLATEDLVYMLEGMGYQTSINLQALIDMRTWLEEQVQHTLPARTSAAGLP